MNLFVALFAFITLSAAVAAGGEYMPMPGFVIEPPMSESGYEFESCKVTCEKGLECGADVVDECQETDAMNKDGKCVEYEKCLDAPCAENEETDLFCSVFEQHCKGAAKEGTNCETITCSCKSGYARGDNGKCVLQSKCPNAQCSDMKNVTDSIRIEEPYCATGWELKFPPNEVHCQCKPGYARNADNHCVLIRDCHNIFTYADRGRDCEVPSRTAFYFEGHLHRCLPFKFQGCGGNANNFHSLSDCQEAFKNDLASDPVPMPNCTNGLRLVKFKASGQWDDAFEPYVGKACEDEFCPPFSTCQYHGSFAFCCAPEEMDEKPAAPEEQEPA